MVYDLIVVGGGPAGSTCARKAAQLGLDVLILEKENHPRRKACGGGLTIRVKNALDLDFTQVVERELCGQRFYYPSGKSKTYLQPDVAGHTVLREDFDHFLLQKAEESGATIHQGSRVTDIIEEVRLIKSDYEIGRTFHACRVINKGHKVFQRYRLPGCPNLLHR